MSFWVQKIIVLSLTVSAITDFLHVKTHFLPKTSSTKPNRQVMFPLQSTCLAQGQVILAASLCTFSTSSFSLLEPDLLLTINEYRSKETSWCSGYKHDLFTPLGLYSTPSLHLQGRFNTNVATRKPELHGGESQISPKNAGRYSLLSSSWATTVVGGENISRFFSSYFYNHLFFQKQSVVRICLLHQSSFSVVNYFAK